ncbi:hypothetical protein CN311_12940 [Mesorhizobium sanjuanii]|uniref:Uncharacterized protein n=1 Tax=Mesorhizobium sanjuanii TaxID=2037900 RepID=A0A2A6FGX8_9HYPH|nr:hypothetical protein CN311_12940 [Mesorhizobium sanjuanii]
MVKPAFSLGEAVGLNLLLHQLLVVVVMMVVVANVMTVMVMIAVMLCMQGRSIGAVGADDRHRDGKCDCESECGQEGLLHDFVSFLRGPRFQRH